MNTADAAYNASDYAAYYAAAYAAEAANAASVSVYYATQALELGEPE